MYILFKNARILTMENNNIFHGCLLVKDNKITGITTEDGETIYLDACILTTGTYLKADILVGDSRTPEGPHGEKRANFLSDNLEKLGFKIVSLEESSDFAPKKGENCVCLRTIAKIS